MSAFYEGEFPRVDFQTYRSYCDRYTSGFRKTGILSAASYAKAAKDASTQWLVTDEGSLPVLVDIAYADRYHADRCRRLTDCTSTMFLAVPPAQLIRHNREPWAERGDFLFDHAVVVESLSNGNNSGISTVPRVQVCRSLYPETDFLPKSFDDPRLADLPDHASAWMAMFDIAFDALAPVALPGLDGLEAVEQAWRVYCGVNGMAPLPKRSSDGTYLLTSDVLRGRQDLVDGLWQVSEVGFGQNLGAFHPQDMAVSRAFFEEQILHNDTLTVAHFIDGMPRCFGFLDFSLERADWLNTSSPTIAGATRRAASWDRELVHFHELIADGEAGMGHGTRILDLFFSLASLAGRNYHAVFESTNLSAIYIPKIANRSVLDQPGLRLASRACELERLDYWYMYQRSDL